MTAMMKQYLDIKKDYEDCILFFRLGDFYEMFYEDAIVASKELGIALTSRDKGSADDKTKVAMCGVPFHSAESYIAKLTRNGYKVAICEQTNTPQEAKKKDPKAIVDRKVIRVITPGTTLDTNVLENDKNNYTACIYQGKNGFGLSVADVSTGEFLTKSFPADMDRKLIDEIAKFAPSEIIINEGVSIKTVIEGITSLKLHVYEPWAFDESNAYKLLCKHFNVSNLNSFGVESLVECIIASGALLEYLNNTQMQKLSNIIRLKNQNTLNCMHLDISSRNNLELTKTIRSGDKKGSLLHVLDKTKTPMGARLLKKWIEEPLLSVEEINMRLDTVESYKNDDLFREELKEKLINIKDIERTVGKIVYNTANNIDMLSLKESLSYLPKIKALIETIPAELNQSIFKNFDELEDIYNMIDIAIKEDAPPGIKDGGFIKDGVHKDLDMYRDAQTKGTDWLLQLENEEIEKTGIKKLKIKYSRVFGYCIEITNTYRDQVPEDRYIRRQTLANAERYITPKLKEIEEKILSATEKIVEIELAIFNKLRSRISENAARVSSTATDIATIDALYSFAEVAKKNSYVKPVVNNGGIIDIKGSRHPVIETLSQFPYVANDIYIDNEDNRIFIITGPNMAGKSTYMRGCALNVLMAQCGSFVSADSSVIGVVDKIFTRVGASDDLATGQSTFMVEMNEVANILNTATQNSLLILDEIGRGTSTYDGLSIAWAIIEHIADTSMLGAKTLFATHYHEITDIEGTVDGIVNYAVNVKEVDGQLVFLRKVTKGSVDKSYGIQVAQLAGLPNTVINRAHDIMMNLTHTKMIERPGSDHGKDADPEGTTYF